MKTTSILLMAVFILSIALSTACANSEGKDTALVSNTAQTEQETVSEEEAALAALPEGDFNGRQFVFLI